MAAGLFISYRRDESRHAAGRLAEDLAQVFGVDAIFRDIEGIDPGVDFSSSLERALGSCVVMLVLMGPRWIDISDAQGRRRLDDPQDWIRQEIATALSRNVRVVPVLLEGAPIPAAASLPADLQPLVRRQAFELSDTRWRGDLQRLATALARIPELSRIDVAPPASAAAAPSPPITPPPPPAGPPAFAPVPAPAPMPAPTPAAPPARSGRKAMLTGIAIGALGLLGVAALLNDERSDPDLQPVRPQESMPIPMPLPMPLSTQPPSPLQSPTASSAPANVAGLWRTNTGEVYDFRQEGGNVRFTAGVNGMQVGAGSGGFDGPMLRLSMTMNVQGMMVGPINCNMSPAADQRSYTGSCNGPNGPFQAHFFR